MKIISTCFCAIALLGAASCAAPIVLDTSVPIAVPEGADPNLTENETKMILAMRQNNCEIRNNDGSAAKRVLAPIGFIPSTAKSALRTIRDKGYAVDDRDASGKMLAVKLKPEVCA